MNNIIPIITEQTHGNTWWFYALSKSISQGAANRRCKVEIYKQGLSSDQIMRLSNTVMVASHSDDFLQETTQILKSAHKKPLLLSENGYFYGSGVSSVSASHDQQARLAYSYLKQCDHVRIALLGFRTDFQRYLFEVLLKHAQKMSIDIPESAIYYAHSSMDYFHRFIDEVHRYNAVICPNYQVALTLLSFCKAWNIRVPEDIYIIAYTNAIATEYTVPSITTISIDAERFGQHCLDLWIKLMDAPHQEISVCINLPVRLQIRKSTDNIPYSGDQFVSAVQPLKPYKNSSLLVEDIAVDSSMYNLEKCLQQCDSIDIDLISLILQGVSYEAISERLFISIGSLRYRVSKLYANAGTENRKQFERLFKLCLPVEGAFQPHKKQK